jgi:putative endonuclease
VERNWRCPQGEIDLGAHDGVEWGFVEGRTRRASSTDPAIESVTPAKRNRLILASQAYLEAHALDDQPWRIDLVVIALTPAGRQIEVLRDAAGW